ncbi:hypothetical protein M0R45_009973 [Rubus argutus]|uniref:protein-serine/threonine phosphatase n=1 Tax=Rubus argutus TaxID=59490 RepID=A0AAW1Y6F3_RUBAR
MSAGTDTPSSLSNLDGSYRKNVTVTRDEKSNTFENMKQPNIGKPPRHLSAIRYCVSSAQLAPAEVEFDSGIVSSKSASDSNSPFVPVFRSGSCSEIGPKQFMEDEYVCIDNILEHLGSTADFPSSGAFYGVFDGHGGTDAASFIRENILRFIVEDSHFPFCAKQAIKSAFLKADHAFADTGTLDSSSGTTALTALISGRTMLIANAGDCRAVLGRRGRAVELSKDHKPNCASERVRIEELGGSSCPLSAEPELEETILSEEDEFLILGCDGLWDVMSSQCAVTIARKELMLHNDPERCSRELVREALKRDTCDNLTVVVVCFSPEPPPQLEIPKFKFKRSISAEGLNLLQEV